MRNRGRLGIMMISIVVILFGVVLLIQISDSKSRLSELTVRESELIEQRDEQLAVQEELEEERVYVQTKMYVEEVAKKIGLVYPDEVIFKPED
ncbi:MAG: septum formation initiator family protein [Eubacterium sp.]